MRLLYNILFPFLFLIAAPFYFWKLARRGQWREGFAQRFGFYGGLNGELADQHVIWLHAVSVGEANLAVQLVNSLQDRNPGATFVVSTTTTTGMGVLRAQLPDTVRAVYYPVDWLPFVRRAFRAIQPATVILVEAEIWPNLFWEATHRQVPVNLVNARLSEKSFVGYRRFGWLFQPLFASLQSVGVQHEGDAKRMQVLGCNPDCLRITGNMKFDGAPDSTAVSLVARELLAKLEIPDTASVLVAGSTFEGEEELLCEFLVKWKTICPDLFLVLVPRHFERADRLMEQLSSTGLKIARRTQLEHSPKNPEVLLVDSTGELTSFYEAATLVFVGKSLSAQGGQNPIEPAALGKPMIFGPFMQNFRVIVKSMLDVEAAVQVTDEEALRREIADLLGNPDRREKLGARALDLVQAHKGATQRTAEMLGQSLWADELKS